MSLGVVKQVEPFQQPVFSVARPLATYRVSESGVVGGMDFSGVAYHAQVAERGFRFGSKDLNVSLGAPRVEQGTLSLECAGGTFSRPSFGVGRRPIRGLAGGGAPATLRPLTSPWPGSSAGRAQD